MKKQLFYFTLLLIATLASCKSVSEQRVFLVVESVELPPQSEEEIKARQEISDQIDSYIDKQRQIVLETKPSEVYTINIPSDLLVLLDEGDLWRIDMYYLGELSSSKRKVLFEDAEYGYSQYSPHGNQRLLIYNDQNQLEGLCTMYLLDIPKIVGGDFIELKSESDCNQTTTLNLKDSIPNEIFIKCMDNYGDIYSFYKEETN